MTVVDDIVMSAKNHGIDPLLAIATAIHESNLNPQAIGDGGTSFGLFQLHRGGELGNLTENQAFDPTINSNTALAVFQATRNSSGAMGGQLAANSQRPANPSAYATAVQGIYDVLSESVSTNKNPDYNTLVSSYQSSGGNLSNAIGTNTAQPSSDISTGIWQGVIDGLGLGNVVSPTSNFATGLKGFLTGLFLPATWVRATAGILGVFLIVVGLTFIVKELKSNEHDS